jgi:hypothetical protein
MSIETPTLDRYGIEPSPAELDAVLDNLASLVAAAQTNARIEDYATLSELLRGTPAAGAITDAVLIATEIAEVLAAEVTA